ncbi:hypothetical protein E3N88_28195 [Mikania micrantha]|uniref:Uncharacterized protein n=1 Tax=Mikania micrantha TaxID=192012 RepID=A0A5N6N0E1_9ASTR|nr:hypothetical protein E3N88_28195 [Mikania micrantha]
MTPAEDGEGWWGVEYRRRWRAGRLFYFPMKVWGGGVLPCCGQIPEPFPESVDFGQGFELLQAANIINTTTSSTDNRQFPSQ